MEGRNIFGLLVTETPLPIDSPTRGLSAGRFESLPTTARATAGREHFRTLVWREDGNVRVSTIEQTRSGTGVKLVFLSLYEGRSLDRYVGVGNRICS